MNAPILQDVRAAEVCVWGAGSLIHRLQLACGHIGYRPIRTEASAPPRSWPCTRCTLPAPAMTPLDHRLADLPQAPRLLDRVAQWLALEGQA